MDFTSNIGPWFRVLADRIPGGVVLLDDCGIVRFADSTASQLLQAGTDEALQLAVSDVLRLLGDRDRGQLESTSAGPTVLVERCDVAEGDGAGTLLVLRDCVELEAAELDLLLANRMRGLENLYRTMAHDLKSPLHAIVLNLDLVRERLRGADLEQDERGKVDSYLDVIQTEISRLGRAIQSMLSQASSGENRRRRIDLRRVQREVVTLLEPLARSKRIRLQTRLPKRSVTVLGNRDRLKQAVLNLAVNAIEAMDERGQLEFDLEVNGESARLAIADDGPGIPAELESKVFERHFTTKKTGNGIGLGVARSVARAHGGELELLRQNPRGTIARLSLPLVERR